MRTDNDISLETARYNHQLYTHIYYEYEDTLNMLQTEIRRTDSPEKLSILNAELNETVRSINSIMKNIQYYKTMIVRYAYECNIDELDRSGEISSETHKDS